jgi:hypothetical protein
MVLRIVSAALVLPLLLSLGAYYVSFSQEPGTAYTGCIDRRNGVPYNVSTDTNPRCRVGDTAIRLASYPLANLDARYVLEGQAESITPTMLAEELRHQIKCAAHPIPGVGLSGCDLGSARLTDLRLQQANLSGANLSIADLTGTWLANADLTGANLLFANLTDAVLFGANLTGADLEDATVTGADFTSVIWSNTTCPDGTNSNDIPNCGF